MDLRLPPQAKFCIKKSLKGIYPFWENLYKKITNFGDFEGCKPIFKAIAVKFGVRYRPRTPSPCQL